MKRTILIMILCTFVFYSDKNGICINTDEPGRNRIAFFSLSDSGEKFCFARGTLVMMADGTSKPIEQIVPGDKILSINISGMKIEEDVVEKADSAIHNNFVKIIFDDLTENINTDDHPYYVKGKGWCSVNPEATFRKYKIHTGSLKPGDECYKILNGKPIIVRISTIYRIPGRQTGFSIVRLNKNSNFFAGNKLVSAEEPETGKNQPGKNRKTK